MNGTMQFYPNEGLACQAFVHGYSKSIPMMYNRLGRADC